MTHMHYSFFIILYIMPIDICSSLNTISNAAFGNDTLKFMFQGSIALGFAIALMCVLLIMILYPAKSGTSIIIVLKLFLYMFMLSVSFIFIHDSILKRSLNASRASGESMDFIRGVTTGGRDPVYGNYVQIKPTTYEGNYEGNSKERVVEKSSISDEANKILCEYPPEEKKNPYAD